MGSPCHRCPRPAVIRAADGPAWCAVCIAAELTRIKPYATLAIEALQAVGLLWADKLAREVAWHVGLYDAGRGMPTMAELERLGYE